MNKYLTLSFVALLLIAAPSFALNAPANFNAIATPGVKVHLAWQDVPGAAGYNVYRKEGPGEFTRLNFSPVSAANFDDKGAIQGKIYEYCATALNGGESSKCAPASAPSLTMKASTLITHPGSKPVTIKDPKTKKIIDVAAPGDIIQYKISIANNGYGQAANTTITYPVPAGTKLLPLSPDQGSFKAEITFFDAKLNQWLSKIQDESSVTKIRFTIVDPIDPKPAGENGSVSFKVLINT